MFNSSYPFQYKRYSNISEGKHPYQRHIYTFEGKQNHIYQVHIEEYEYKFFALKFHVELEGDETEHKYERLSHLYEVAPVLRTCLNIMLAIRKEQPLASFGFVGAPLPGQTKNKSNTKRYGLYRKIMANFFSPIAFHHFIHEAKSAYLLLNKEMNKQDAELLAKFEKMLEELHFSLK